MLINGRLRPSHAQHGGGDLLPAVAAADAVGAQAGAPLEAPEGFFRPAAEDAVDAVPGLVAQRREGVLEDHDVAAPAAPAEGGVACRGASAGRRAVAPVEVDPCGGLAQRLDIAPRPGGAGGVVDGGALGPAEALPHIEGHAGIVLAAGAVASLPDAAEGVSHRDAPAVFAAGEVPRFHCRDGRPEHRAVRFAPELPHGQSPAGAVGHGVVLAQARIGVDSVLVGVIDQ